jgi:hypothetical protein
MLPTNGKISINSPLKGPHTVFLWENDRRDIRESIAAWFTNVHDLCLLSKFD